MKLRSDFLGKVGGIEEKAYLKVGNEKIIAIPETDVDRTSEEGKASSVQFLHFNFTNAQIEKFKNIETEVLLGIDHNLYNHIAKISKENKNALMQDFN